MLSDVHYHTTGPNFTATMALMSALIYYLKAALFTRYMGPTNTDAVLNATSFLHLKARLAEAMSLPQINIHVHI